MVYALWLDIRVEIKSKFGPYQLMLLWIKRFRTMVAVCKQLVRPEENDSCSPERSERSWLGNWLWDLIWKIQAYCYSNTGSIYRNSALWNTWSLTERTNVPRSDTTNNKSDHTSCQIWPTMLHISCVLTKSSTLNNFNKLLGLESFQNPSRINVNSID